MTFREMCEGKPSKALRSMIEGLEAAEKRPDFKIDMGTFGRSADGICFGCAATCAVQQLTNYEFTPDNLMGENFLNQSEALGCDPVDLIQFETAINGFRTGSPFLLLNYFDKAAFTHEVARLMGYFHMGTDNYREYFPKVEKIIEYLESKRL